MNSCAGNDEDRLYDYLLDSGVLDDVKTVAESVVGSASMSSSSAVDAAEDDPDADDDARRIADRLLEQNADDVERALNAIVRDLRLAAAEPGQLVDYRWPGLLDLHAGQPPRKTLRNLNALLRLPFTYDTYTGAYFHKLTKGLERTFAVDAFFHATVLVYAKLVDAAPDLEGAVESFGSLCEAVRLRCLRSRDFGKSVTSVCLLTRCLRAICKRASGSKNVKPAVVEFVATVSGDAGEHRGPYAILCCADPTARWFDRVSKCYSSRSVFFECLHGDGRLLKTVVSSFFHWITAPKIPKSDRLSDVAVDYACSLHAIHLLAKMFKYRSARTVFPVRVSRTVKIHAVNVSDYCLGFLSANRDRVPTTLASGLCELVAAVAAFHAHEVVDSVAASEFGARILADVAERPDAFRAVIEREHAVDELFRTRRRRDGARVEDSLVRVATALSRRHEHIWRLVTRRMSFLEAAVAAGADRSSADRDGRSLMANIRCTPLGALTYHLGDGRRPDDVDWSDPRQKLLFGVACASDRGRDWLNRNGAFASANRFVEARLDEAETSLDPDDRKRLDPVVDVACAYCASVEGKLRENRA